LSCSDKRRGFIILIVLLALVCVPTIKVQAKSNNSHGYIFKSKMTKVYSYPRKLHAHSEYLGRAGNVKAVCFAVKTIQADGISYVKLVWPTTQRLNGVHPINHREGYVRRSALKRVNLVSSQIKLPSKTYWLKSSTYNFWAHAYGTVQRNREIHASRGELSKTLYAVSQVKTRDNRVYLEVRTKTGKRLGWINREALGRGPYLDPTSYLTQNTSFVRATWVNPRDSRVKITALTAKHNLRKLIIQSNDGTAIVIHFNGGPNTYFKIKRNRERTKEKEYSTNISSRNLAYLYFDVQTGQISMRVVTPDENADTTYLVEMNLMGTFTSIRKVKTISYI